MPAEGTVGSIGLREALGDSPKTQALIGSLEGCVAPLKDYASLLRDTCQACNLHQKKLCKGTNALSKLVASVEPELTGGSGGPMSAYAQLGRYLNELHSCQEMLSTQLENAVVLMLSNFLSEDIAKLERLKETYDSAKQEHDQAMVKFSRTSKKRDSEKTRFEANAELYAARRKFYECSLKYCSELNSFQHERQCALLEPLLTFMHAQTAFFKVAHGVLNEDFEKLLTTFNSEVQSVQQEQEAELRAMAAEREKLELEFPTLCLPDPDPADPFMVYQPPDIRLVTKAGYLFHRVRSGPGLTRWERAYFYTKDKLLFIQSSQKAAEVLLQLRDAEATAGDIDDRRYVFQVTHPSIKRPLFFTAECDLLKDEWIAAINNISSGKESSEYSTSSTMDAEAVRLERERIRSWVNKEIHEPGKKSKQTKSQPPTPPGSAKEAPSKPETFVKKSPLRSLMQRKQDQLIEQQLQQLQHMGLSTAVPEHSEANGKPLSLSQSSETFVVKQLGSADVIGNTDAAAVNDAIRKVMAARKNMKPAFEVELLVTHKRITLTNRSLKKVMVQTQLKDIVYCSAQSENERLFGIIVRTSRDPARQKFLCHVLEAEKSAKPICSAVTEAIQTAWKIIQSKSGRRPTITASGSSQQAVAAVKEKTSTTPSKPVRHALSVPVAVSLSSSVTTGGMKPSQSTSSLSSSEHVPAPQYRSSSDSNLPVLVESSLQQLPHPPRVSASAETSTASSSAGSSYSDLTFKTQDICDPQPLIMLESPSASSGSRTFAQPPLGAVPELFTSQPLLDISTPVGNVPVDTFSPNNPFSPEEQLLFQQPSNHTSQAPLADGMANGQTPLREGQDAMGIFGEQYFNS